METGFLTDIIKEMLVSNGVACLPGFGAFRTEQVPAFFSDKGFTVNPPYLRPVFDSAIQDDMGLVEFYAAANNLSRVRAQSVISEAVADIRRELSLSRALLLPGMGYLRMTHDSNVFFVADEKLEIFPQYDMLEPVSLRHMPAFSSYCEPQSELQPEPQPESHIGPQAQPQAVADAGSQAQSAEDIQPAAKKLLPRLLMLVLVLALVFFATLAVLGRMYPELIDPLLYSAEELEIINTVL